MENALYEESGVLEAAAVGVPDQRLGELVTAVVTIKQGYSDKVTEKSLIDFVRGRYVLCIHSNVFAANGDAIRRLPRFAVPVMVIVQTTEMGELGYVLHDLVRLIISGFLKEHTPSGKIKKGTLREIVRKEWEKRQSTGAKGKL